MTLAENPGTSTTGIPSKIQINEGYLRLYSEQGFRVFPAENKQPAIVNWQGTASSDLDMLLESYSLFGGKFRNNEIGVCTGRTFIVVDDDGEEIEGLMPPHPALQLPKRG